MKYIVTRASQYPNTIYVDADGQVAVVHEDGEGRFWYDTVDEAREQHGDLPVRHIDVIEE